MSNQSYIGGFNDENFGITVGYAGESKYTTDSGKTWREGKNSSQCRFGLAIINDKDNGRVFYYTSELLLKSVVTKDGGDTWKNEKVPEICGQGLFLSQDGKLLSVNSSIDKSIVLLKGK